MTERREIAVVRWPGYDPGDEGGLARLLADYHLRTEAEKGRAVTGVDGLPDRYRAEITDPRTAFAADAVLLASSEQSAVGCLVVTAPVDGCSEIKRLWADPAHRGRGVASRLIEAAVAHATESGVSTLRLSVWQWRTGAIALYERLGFTPTESWDPRDQLVCMRRGL
ncbi:GNAT family N-acetyltransferase [Streptomyces neyagawaensis]|uniref:GNAT family N-acetyltransferase n=1 Tax=Streptomyces neyagawaensis TaxID=42238 RepID=UPI00201CB771|nr:GNAT family N-acetyltransferase [Streptomyces neyagawaensis]MCL6731309.1 GNAT family N-acetyltransferase [Streptomyces neyagawaensis]MDE1683567.1 GNAT family N-acetyltransferase [Streptomyces neyagawaensis]